MSVFSIVLLCSQTTSGQPLSNATTPNANATAANATAVNQTAQPSPNNIAKLKDWEKIHT